VRVLHLTDLHVQVRPHGAELLGKRLLATVNLYVMGRQKKFSPQAQQAAVAATLALEPDVVVITGDLTAQSTEAEFLGARQLLAPITSRLPTLVIAGNHDTYVHSERDATRLRAHFAPQMDGGTMPYLVQHGEVAFLAIESCRSHLLSSGRVPQGQLAKARELLEGLPQPRPFVFLMLHYPLRGRDGLPYGPPTRSLSNAAEVEAFLAGTDRVDAVLHGHEHHGFRTTIATAGGEIPVLDPGASGYAFLPDQDRTAHLNLYEVDRGGLHKVERYRFDGQDFCPEPGGAYATGR